MPAQILHDTDEIIAWALWNNRALGADPTPWRASFAKKAPTPTTSWPVFHGKEPSEPDNVLSVFRTTDLILGRVMTGEQQELKGFTVRVRCSDKGTGARKALDIKHDFERSFYNQQITIDNQQYFIPCISEVRLIPLQMGDGPQGKSMWFWNLNCLCPILAYPITG